MLVILMAASMSCSTGNRLEGYVYYRLNTNPTTLDPALIVDVMGGQIAAKLFNGLVRLDDGLRIAPDIADSWEVMARWIGARPETLKATIDEYNDACDHGYDKIFNKDRRFLIPLCTRPFYALRCYPVFLSAQGGIIINHRMEVLNSNYDPINGLYAVGNDASGWDPKDHYNAILSGHAYGFALNSGRIAGENASAQVLRE